PGTAIPAGGIRCQLARELAGGARARRAPSRSRRLRARRFAAGPRRRSRLLLLGPPVPQGAARRLARPRSRLRERAGLVGRHPRPDGGGAAHGVGLTRSQENLWKPLSRRNFPAPENSVAIAIERRRLDATGDYPLRAHPLRPAVPRRPPPPVKALPHEVPAAARGGPSHPISTRARSGPPTAP